MLSRFRSLKSSLPTPKHRASNSVTRSKKGVAQRGPSFSRWSLSSFRLIVSMLRKKNISLSTYCTTISTKRQVLSWFNGLNENSMKSFGPQSGAATVKTLRHCFWTIRRLLTMRSKFGDLSRNSKSDTQMIQDGVAQSVSVKWCWVTALWGRNSVATHSKH